MSLAAWIFLEVARGHRVKLMLGRRGLPLNAALLAWKCTLRLGDYVPPMNWDTYLFTQHGSILEIQTLFQRCTGLQGLCLIAVESLLLPHAGTIQAKINTSR